MADNRKLKQFHSCFIVDVEIDESSNEVRLLDSNRMKYVYRLDSGVKAEGFKGWLTSVFLAGKAQTLSVFRYHEERRDPDVDPGVDVIIDKFLIGPAPMLLESEKVV